MKLFHLRRVAKVEQNRFRKILGVVMVAVVLFRAAFQGSFMLT